MNDFKTQFEKWLADNGCSKSMIATNLRLMNKISNEHFSNVKDWREISENLLPLLAKYYELANHSYYLDQITIWPALKYFDVISDVIFENSRLPVNQNVSLFIYDGQEAYFVCNTNLKAIYDDIRLLNRYLYESDDELKEKFGSSIDTMKLSMLISELYENPKVDDVKRLAIHIVYDKKGIAATKATLTKYCNFCSSNNLTPNHLKNAAIELISKKNPNKTIKGQYKISQQLTGTTPLQIGLKGETVPFYHNYDFYNENYLTDFILVKEDLYQILNLDKKTVNKYFIRKDNINNLLVDPKEIEKKWLIKQKSTVIRHYFSMSSTNQFLENGLKKIKIKHAPVDYSCEGYRYWVTRLEATKFLGISHNAFHDLIDSGNCSRIEYIPGYLRYYSPDIEYLKTTFSFKKAIMRKRKYNKHK